MYIQILCSLVLNVTLVVLMLFLLWSLLLSILTSVVVLSMQLPWISRRPLTKLITTNNFALLSYNVPWYIADVLSHWYSKICVAIR